MITINGKSYREMRCATCRKLICYEYILAGRIAFACPRCDNLTEFQGKHADTLENRTIIKDQFTIQFIQRGGE